MGSRQALRVLSRLVALFAACVLFVALPGCTAGRARTTTKGSTHDATETAGGGAKDAIRRQASIVTGRKDVRLDPMSGAQAWLGSRDLAAYVDPTTHDEFVADESRGLLLSYMPGTDVYQEPLGLAPYPGEPPRAEVLRMADEWARKYSPTQDIASMRRTAKRRVMGEEPRGDMLEYSVEYRRYVDGVRMPEWTMVTIALPSWSWKPSRSAFVHSDPFQSPPPPAITVLEAIVLASKAAGIADYRVESADLAVWDGKYIWQVELSNASPAPNVVGNHGAWVSIDAVSGATGGVAR